MKILLAAGLLSCLIVPAYSQECTSIASVMGRETQRFGDQEQKSIAMKARLCSARYESSTSDQRAEIEASYSLFSGGANGSSSQIHTLQDQQCDEKFGSYWSSKITSSDINKVSQVGAEVVRACLSSQSFRLVGLSLEDEGVSASYRFNGNGSTKVSGISASPADLVTDCRVFALGKEYTDLQKISGLDLPSGSTLTLTCARKSRTGANTDGVQRYNGGILTVATDSDSPRLPLIAYSVPVMPESAADAINRKLDAITKLMTAPRTQIKVKSNADAKNDSDRPLLVTATCNGTNQRKVIEGYVSGAYITSASGSERINISFLVPPQATYKVAYALVPDESCDVAGWGL